jgi:hypothetical protein
MVEINCSGSLSPAYAYKGAYPPLGNEGRYPSACFDDPAGAVREIATVDLAESGQWGSYGIQVDTNGDGAPDTETTIISNPVTVAGKKAIVLESRPVSPDHPSVNPKDPNPFGGGLSVSLSNDGRYLNATHIELWVRPENAATLIVELYDQDSAAPTNQCSEWNTTPPGPAGCLVGGLGKNPANYWLPTTGDQSEVKLHLAATGGWQRLLIPLGKFVDWNRARAGLKQGGADFIPGITENIGDGQLNPKPGEEFALQFTLVGADWGSQPFRLALGQHVRFVTMGQKK